MSDPIFTGDSIAVAATEATYGTDAAPTAAANAMRVKSSFSLAKIDLEAMDYDAGRPGSKGSIEKNRWVEGNMDGYLAGAGTATGIDPLAPLLKSAGLTLTPAADHVAIGLADLTAMDSTSVKFFRGKVRHDILGLRSDWEIKLSVDNLPKVTFPNAKGLYSSPSVEASLQNADLSAFKNPLSIDPVNFVKQQIFGFDAAIAEITIKGGNNVVFVPEANEMRIIDRQITVDVTFREPLPTVKNFYDLVGTYGAIAIQLGQDVVDEGRIFEAGVDNAQLVDISNTERHGQSYLQAKFECVPTARNNDIWMKTR